MAGRPSSSLLWVTPVLTTPALHQPALISLLAQWPRPKGEVMVLTGERLCDPGSIQPWTSHMSGPSRAGVELQGTSAQSSQAGGTFRPCVSTSFSRSPDNVLER